MKDKIKPEELMVNVFKQLETKDMAVIFERYMHSIGARKMDKRRNDNSNTYLIDGKDSSWNRVECYYHKDNDTTYGTEDLSVVLRKRQGRYLIVSRKGKRALEISYGHIIKHDKRLLIEIIKDHKEFFMMLKEEIGND